MSSLTQTRIAFLLGSGTSIPAGMPSTQVITKQILSGEALCATRMGTIILTNLYTESRTNMYRGWWFS